LEIKALDVKKLREKTGAGILDCKNALVTAKGDFQSAEKALKKMGLAAVAKRSGKATNEGRIFVGTEGNKAGIIEISCETDFVARNKEFIDTGNKLLSNVIRNQSSTTTDELKNLLEDLKVKIKENMTLRRVKSISCKDNELLMDYTHGEGKIGVIVKLKSENPESLKNQKVRDFAFNSALHIAAYNPPFLSKELVEDSYLKEQEEIFTAQTKKLGKPENILQGIVKGKLNKHLSEICFLNQAFVKDDKKSVQEVINELGKEVGDSISITDYIYYKVGEEV